MLTPILTLTFKNNIQASADKKSDLIKS